MHQRLSTHQAHNESPSVSNPTDVEDRTLDFSTPTIPQIVLTSQYKQNRLLFVLFP